MVAELVATAIRRREVMVQDGPTTMSLLAINTCFKNDTQITGENKSEEERR
jgi:hypothetical protein